ncbi:MAG: hypothetical protein LBQ94_11275 [Treponema sp.]|jgi:hypothetical protein|nr:hypothetical protein [Treponema sp.]
MKKISVLAMLALVLVFGLAFVGCSSGSNGPELTEIYVVTRADWEAGNVLNPKTTIAANEQYMIRYIGKAPYEELTGFRIIIKRGATVVSDNERGFTTSTAPIRDNFSFVTGSYVLPAGTYTIDVYVVDTKGNKSNTKTVTLTVTG